MDCFSLFMPDNLIIKISIWANRKIDNWLGSLPQEQMEKYSKSDKYPWIKRTCTQELKALFGLLYIRRMFKQEIWDFHHLWDKEIGHPIFAATMRKARFVFLMRHLCFDDPETRR